MNLSSRKSVLYAWVGWALLFLTAAAIIASGGTRTVVPSYRIAAWNWIAGGPLYNGDGIGGFVYFPQAAVLYIPFAIFPPVVGEVLWRLVIIAVFAAGVRSFSRLAGERQAKELFPLASILAIAMAWDCARNGQSTLIMAGFMLLAVVGMARRQWWRATLWLALAVALKPLAIVLVLLVMAIDRHMSWRVLLGMLILALSPFLLQHPSYVMQQYVSFVQNSAAAAHVAVVGHGWTSPFTALRVAGVNVPEQVQTVIRLVAAAGTLALCFVVQRRQYPARTAVFVYALAALYIILFSPRTENNTYALLGPAMGLFLADAFVSKRTAEGIFLAVIALADLGSRTIERMIAPEADPVWLSPLMATVFAGYVLVRLFKNNAAVQRA